MRQSSILIYDCIRQLFTWKLNLNHAHGTADFKFYHLIRLRTPNWDVNVKFGLELMVYGRRKQINKTQPKIFPRDTSINQNRAHVTLTIYFWRWVHAHKYRIHEGINSYLESPQSYTQEHFIAWTSV